MESQSEHAEQHIAPLRMYLIIFGALLFLTYITVQVSVWNLGTVGLAVALVVAAIKAFLVASYFMHLKDDTWFNIMLFVGSIVFMILFFGLTLLDLGTRGRLNIEEGTFYYQQEKAWSEKQKE